MPTIVRVRGWLARERRLDARLDNEASVICLIIRDSAEPPLRAASNNGPEKTSPLLITDKKADTLTSNKDFNWSRH